MVKIAFLTGVLLLAFAGVACAATSTYTASVPLQGIDWDSTVSLQQFNPSLGTLNSVSLTAELDYVTSISVLNNDGNGDRMRRWVDGTVTLTNIDLGQLISESTNVNDGNIYGATGYKDLDAIANSGQTVVGGKTFSVSGNYAVTTANQALFTGGGSVAFDFNTTTSVTEVLAGGNYTATPNDQASGIVKVVYDYTPVPEPSSILGLLCGVAGLGGLIRFRKR